MHFAAFCATPSLYWSITRFSSSFSVPSSEGFFGNLKSKDSREKEQKKEKSEEKSSTVLPNRESLEKGKLNDGC